MKLYKYRAISAADKVAFQRLDDILQKNQFWCAAPASLNDPEEFIWKCDCRPTERTAPLLAQLLAENGKNVSIEAISATYPVTDNGRLQGIAAPIVDQIVETSRREIGLACFGTSRDNPAMWWCYGGEGAGVCVEIDAPDDLLNDCLHPVEYSDVKVLHIDQLLEASLDRTHGRSVYLVALLSKTSSWAAEAEVRFISKQQNISVNIVGCCISRLILGPYLDGVSTQKILDIVASLPYELPLSYY